MAIGIEYQGVLHGYFGKVSKKVLKLFDIEDDVYVAEVNFELFNTFARIQKKYHEVPKYPPVYRDLAFILDEAVIYSDLERIIRENGEPLIRDVSFFDIYRGEKIGSGKKSVAVALELLSTEKTLTQSEIDGAVSQIVKAVELKLNGSLRS